MTHMTEQDWLKCADSLLMFQHMCSKESERKIRLFLCAVSRHLTHLFFRPWSLTAVEVAERFADGQATAKELDRAEWNAEAAAFAYELDNTTWPYTHPCRMEVVPRLVEIGALLGSVLSGGEW